jgi:S-adenosyl methyltransferase
MMLAGGRGTEAALERPSWAPPEVDIEHPASSRIYDYMLGGSHNFAPDRDVARRAIAAMPELPAVLMENRSFLRRAVAHLAGPAGVDQFLDLGSGIPTVGNVHEVAERINPAARVVYVDIDPVAVAHARAILTGHPGSVALEGDLRDPLAVLAVPVVGALLDLHRPLAVLLVATLHFLPDDQRPGRILAKLAGALAPGSYVAISHASADGRPPSGMRDAQDVYARSNNQVIMRSRDEIAALLTDWEVEPPGIVRCPLWHPETGEPTPPDDQFPGYAVLARLP